MQYTVKAAAAFEAAASPPLVAVGSGIEHHYVAPEPSEMHLMRCRDVPLQRRGGGFVAVVAAAVAGAVPAPWMRWPAVAAVAVASEIQRRSALVLCHCQMRPRSRKYKGKVWRSVKEKGSSVV